MGRNFTNGDLAPTYRELREQLADPQHCYIELAPGLLFSHHQADVEMAAIGLAGKSVRFTRLAARRMVASLNVLGGDARIIEPLDVLRLR